MTKIFGKLAVCVIIIFRKWSAKTKFRKDFNKFRELSTNNERDLPLRWEERLPCLNDRTSITEFDRHYVFHLAWAARILAATIPSQHVDISSSLAFCTLVSAFMPVRFYDYRPAILGLTNLDCNPADLLALPFDSQSVDSVSCMHVVEHVGLGRYGDPLDPEGDLKSIAELKRILAVNGNLLFVVPIGRPRIMFNGHRIYTYKQIISYFKGLDLVEFALIPDNPNDGGILTNATKEMADAQSYGCGCFWFKRITQ